MPTRHARLSTTLTHRTTSLTLEKGLPQPRRRQLPAGGGGGFEPCFTVKLWAVWPCEVTKAVVSSVKSSEKVCSVKPATSIRKH